MSWLRIDDGFPQHPKFESWKPVEKWAWLEMMAYCARFSTAGRIPSDAALWPRSVTPRLLDLALVSGWIDEREDGLWIHDWEKYNPADATGAERARRYRTSRKERDADRDDVRDDDRDDERDENGASRAGARARARPVPSLETASEQAGRSEVRRAPAEPAGLDHIADDVLAFRREHGLDDEGGET